MATTRKARVPMTKQIRLINECRRSSIRHYRCSKCTLTIHIRLKCPC